MVVGVYLDWLTVGNEGIKLILPVPPSTNQRLTLARGRMILSKSARDYMQWALILRGEAAKKKIRSIENYTDVFFLFYLKNENYDCHNGLKILCDVMEKGNLFTNDRFILPQIKKPKIDKHSTRVEIYYKSSVVQN